MSIKEKISNLFLEEYIENIEEDKKVDKKKLSKSFIVSLTGIFNFILNILYMNFICYSGSSIDIGFYFFMISFIWALITIITSYKLGDEKNNFLFYVNVLLFFFLSKMWFVYM